MQHTFGGTRRHWKPAVTEYRERRRVFVEHICLELGYSLGSRNAGEMLQQPASDASSLPGVCDGEAYLRRPADRGVATFGDDKFVASARNGGNQSHVVPVAHIVEPPQVVFAESLLGVKEASANGLRLEMQKGLDKALLVIGAYGTNGHLVAVLRRFLNEISRYIRHVSA